LCAYSRAKDSSEVVALQSEFMDSVKNKVKKS